MNDRLKRLARSIGPLRLVYWRVKSLAIKDTRSYWERRYRGGGTSGPGSYGRLATYKADFLNDFVIRECVRSVVELGCGDGHQLSLARYPSYIGLDVSRTVISACVARFRDDQTKSFFLYDADAFCDRQRLIHADLAMSLDVVYHLVEDHVFEAYMKTLFAAADRFVIVYSSNHDETLAAYIRHRRFTDWVERNASAWRLRERVPNPYPYDPARPNDTSFADFFVFQRA